MTAQLELPLAKTSTARRSRAKRSTQKAERAVSRSSGRSAASRSRPESAAKTAKKADDAFRLEPSPPARTRPTAAEVRRLERALGRRLGRRLVVRITENRRHLVTGRVREGVLQARIHIVFLKAPDAVLDAVARFFDPSEDHTIAERQIQAFVEENRELLSQTRVPFKERAPQGSVHDLQQILDDLNARYFDGQLAVQITWSRGARGQRRKSMQLGAYIPEESLIRIHPALDQAFVPEYFVSCVIFHEMLHAVHGVTEQDGRRRIHSHAFHQDEQRHPDYTRARRWEDRNLRRLLRY